MAKNLSDKVKMSQRLLGLSPREWRVFEIVQKADTLLRVSEIARQAKVKRTTAGYILRTLAKRGLIKKSGTKTRPLYARTDRQEIEEAMQATLQNWPDTHRHTVFHSKTSDISFHRGALALYQLWQEIITLPKYTRLRCIQPDTSFMLALTHLHSQIPYEDFLEINRSLDRRKIIVEAVVHEYSVDTIAKTLIKQGESPIPFLETFVKRAADTAKLPNNFLDVPAELYLFHDVAIMMHWPEEYAIRIKNKAIVNFLAGLFTATKYFSERYNQNERAARKMVELQANDNEGGSP